MAGTERSTKQVVEDTRSHLSELVDAHVALAKAEVKETQQQLVAAIAPLVVAGVLGLYVLGFFAVTGAKALDLVVEEWLAWLIVSGVLAVVLGILGAVGVRRLKKLDPSPTTTKQSVSETVEWARNRAGRDDS